MKCKDCKWYEDSPRETDFLLGNQKDAGYDHEIDVIIRLGYCRACLPTYRSGTWAKWPLVQATEHCKNHESIKNGS